MSNRLVSSLAAAVFSLCTITGHAQNRLTQAISASSPRAEIADNVTPRARRATDLGVLAGNTPIQSVSVRFSLTTAQSAALDQLLSDQQNPASPRYHQWLTPEQYAAQFGLSDSDLQKVSAYLQAQGLTVTSVARSHAFLTVSGTAAQVQSAFGTTLHSVTLDGEQHFANLTEPQLPVALAGVTRGVTGLNDFRLKPRVKARKVAVPDYTSSISGNHYLAPGDIYTIYDINPLLTSSINGSGITIGVMGQTDISLTSAAAFRSAAGLTANAPTVKLYGTDPGTSTNDLDEAMLDVEWSGAIAPSASILYVNSTDVIGGSLTQAIDNNLAPILTISYGDCEQDFGSSNIAVYNQLFKQANAQGQTIVGPAGDSGATDCDYEATTASGGLAVDFPASSPFVTGLGGTMLNEGTGTYFSTTNNTNGGSALSYIPEAVWNETAAFGSLAGGGGGASLYFTKPAYQIGTGVPADSSRDVPDLALDAAAIHDGYLICAPGDCTNGFRNSSSNLDVIGGTSVATPEFAGMLALLEQKIKARVGNANPTIYGLANSTYATSVFHDVTVGTNAEPCTIGTANCPTGGSIGFAATTGYDQASGWGSVDAFNMVNDWLLVTPTGINSTLGSNSSAVSLTASSSSVVAGNSITLTATVASATSGTTTVPTGTVQFLVDNVAVGSAVTLSGTGVATYTLSTTGLTSGAHTVTAAYSGNTVYNGSKSAVAIDIISATAADFSLTPATSTITVASGKTATGVTFTVSPLNGFSGTVNFTATTTSSTLNAGYAFSVNPVTVTTTAAGTTIFTLSAFSSNSATTQPLVKKILGAQSAPAPWKLAGSGAALAGLLCLCLPGLRRKRLTGLLVAAFTIGVFTLSGCSTSGSTTTASGNTNTTPGTYNILVTASGINASGTTVTHNANVTFIVQ